MSVFYFQFCLKFLLCFYFEDPGRIAIKVNSITASSTIHFILFSAKVI